MLKMPIKHFNYNILLKENYRKYILEAKNKAIKQFNSIDFIRYLYRTISQLLLFNQVFIGQII